ncbi:MAG: phosphate signaling complex protein PhoU [Planctomycetota bacterium]|jgi:phosphate transport system protein
MMAHYEVRLEQDLKQIRDRVAELGGTIGRAVGESVHALMRRDNDLAASVILGDLPINRAIRALDQLCHVFVARHLPSAGHLRYISSVLRMTVALERIGDYAVAIARESVQLTDEAPAEIGRDIEMLADHSTRLLKQALKAFHEGDAGLARGAMGMADESKATFRAIFSDLLRVGREGVRPIEDLFALLIVLNRLERVGNQAKNICEETVFAVTGETKQPKVYRVMFADERNDLRSVMAEAIARKTYPNSGRYTSCGWNPAEALDERLVAFLDARGHDMQEARPEAMPPDSDTINAYHVIVDFDGGVAERLGKVPFHTALVRWTDDVAAEGIPDDEQLESLYKQIAHEVRGLMETLRGEDAT